jgi:hypothetical protein
VDIDVTFRWVGLRWDCDGTAVDNAPINALINHF